MSDIEKVYRAYLNGAIVMIGVGALNLGIPLVTRPSNLSVQMGMAALIISLFIFITATFLFPNPIAWKSRQVRKNLTKDYKYPMYFWMPIIVVGISTVLFFLKSNISLSHTLSYSVASMAFSHGAASLIYCSRLKIKMNSN